jgi:receptor-type tyrosine-protein phosphatase gamma
MAQMFRAAFKSFFRPVETNRKCLHSNYYYLDDPNQPQAPPNVDLEAPIIIGGETRSAVYVEDFPRAVSQLHADSDIGFSKEYELIQNESIVDEHSSEHSQHSDNKAKNRYLNIIACKSTSLFHFFLIHLMRGAMPFFA